jgi:hypothetical protein
MRHQGTLFLGTNLLERELALFIVSLSVILVFGWCSGGRKHVHDNIWM